MPTPTDKEALAYARFVRAVNHEAVARLNLENALLTGRDDAVLLAEENLDQAEKNAGLALDRAVAERIALLRAQQDKVLAAHGRSTPGPLEDESTLDDDYDQGEAQVLADEEGERAQTETEIGYTGPPIEHRTDRPGSEFALCGAPMADSVGGPLGVRCQACEAVLGGRIGAVTSSSPLIGR